MVIAGGSNQEVRSLNPTSCTYFLKVKKRRKINGLGPGRRGVCASLCDLTPCTAGARAREAPWHGGPAHVDARSIAFYFPLGLLDRIKKIRKKRKEIMNSKMFTDLKKIMNFKKKFIEFVKSSSMKLKKSSWIFKKISTNLRTVK